jgi:tetratricopeptide (TPR) repeat protein
MNRIEKIIEMLQDQPKDSFLKHALALEYIKIDKEDEAIIQFVELLNNEPDYVGSYYHLAKLYERNQQTDAAIEIYTKGMEVAKKLKDNHNLNELRSAYDNLVD